MAGLQNKKLKQKKSLYSFYHVLKLSKFWSVQDLFTFNSNNAWQNNPMNCPVCFLEHQFVGSGRNIPRFRCKMSILLLFLHCRERQKIFRKSAISTILLVVNYNVTVSSTVTAHTHRMVIFTLILKSLTGKVISDFTTF